MKKLALLIAVLFLLTSCASGWNCQNRYVNKINKNPKNIQLNGINPPSLCYNKTK